MNGEFLFTIYYGGIVIAVGYLAYWQLKRDFYGANAKKQKDKGVNA
ncbi:MAG: hypothetical protein KGZ96_08550 [Clostridia bacterium]|jgi:hypothetical protein|nr:hypothetical protein [Clostridia bacterium]